ncbi:MULTISPECIES: hypothetical protein [unclassified Janthinobacterium]|uniref:hypothetical protein n=2 Tax=Janthinobacterium TaxID=29580 RepID=UPI00161313F3|nr:MULTISPECIES: hypothetical protein [unclassified Janthinobacterium]MBB5368207.1 hypothetical protein [Janthinobacterium sp. K2C7]MBB5379316.1 hypothetical protein [Janthinobacterium sp. K2Li3]MBB5386589.1 hypothetical protein [Janthinobacterium sp. K2E3]
MKIILFKIKYFAWKVMPKDYQFKETNLGPISASDITTVITGTFRAKGFDDVGRPTGYEEIVHIIFPNGAVEELPALEINLKYAAALKQDLLNRPKV